eukprot:Opistho-1_new@52071
MRERQRAAAHMRGDDRDRPLGPDRRSRHMTAERIFMVPRQRPDALLGARADQRMVVERARYGRDRDAGEPRQVLERRIVVARAVHSPQIDLFAGTGGLTHRKCEFARKGRGTREACRRGCRRSFPHALYPDLEYVPRPVRRADRLGPAERQHEPYLPDARREYRRACDPVDRRPCGGPARPATDRASQRSHGGAVRPAPTLYLHRRDAGCRGAVRHAQCTDAVDREPVAVAAHRVDQCRDGAIPLARRGQIARGAADHRFRDAGILHRTGRGVRIRAAMDAYQLVRGQRPCRTRRAADVRACRLLYRRHLSVPGSGMVGADHVRVPGPRRPGSRGCACGPDRRRCRDPGATGDGLAGRRDGGGVGGMVRGGQTRNLPSGGDGHDLRPGSAGGGMAAAAWPALARHARDRRGHPAHAAAAGAAGARPVLHLVRPVRDVDLCDPRSGGATLRHRRSGFAGLSRCGRLGRHPVRRL